MSKKRKQKCNSCGEDFSIIRSKVSVVYCESKHINNQGTKSSMGMEIVSILGGKSHPHLDVTCNTCGFTWLEECYDMLEEDYDIK